MKIEICKNCGKSKEEHYELNNNLYCAFQTIYTEKASKFEPINTPQVTNNKEVSVVSASLSENTQREQDKSESHERSATINVPCETSDFCLEKEIQEEGENTWGCKWGWCDVQDIKEAINLEMGLIMKLNAKEITIEEFLEERNKLFGESLIE